MFFIDNGLDDGSLGFQCPSEIENVSFQDGDLEYHLLLFFREYLGFDEIEFFVDVVEARETGIDENLYEGIEQVSGGFLEIGSPFPMASFQIFEKFRQLIDALPVARDEVAVGENDIEFAAVGRPMLHVEEGDMDGKEQAAVILDDFGLIGRRDELLDRQRMDVEVFLQIGDIILLRIFKIDPDYFFVFDDVHLFFSQYTNKISD